MLFKTMHEEIFKLDAQVTALIQWQKLVHEHMEKEMQEQRESKKRVEEAKRMLEATDRFKEKTL